MKSSDDLHKLIHSLGKSERRYFKLTADSGLGRGHKHTLVLFDAICKLENYDEAALKKSIQEPSLSANFPSSKNRLFEHVLRSQRILRSGESVDSQLAETLLDLETLVEKGLVRAAKKRMRKAKQLASQFEKEMALLQLLAWEQRLFVLDADEPEADFYLRVESEEAACLSRLALRQNLQRSYEQMRSLARAGVQGGGQEVLNRMAILMQQAHLATPPPAEQFMSLQLYHAIRGVYTLARNKAELAWEYFDKVLSAWERYSDRIADESDFYLGCYNNFIVACTLSKQHQADQLQAIQRLRSIEGLPVTIHRKLARIAYFQELNFRIEFGLYADSETFIQELTGWLHDTSPHLQAVYELAFFANITLFYFLHSQFSQAQKWLLKILHFPPTEARADIRDFARIFQLVLQYELGNLDVQEYLLRSAYRYFNRTQKLYDYEEAILTFVKAEQKNAGLSKKASQVAFQKLYDTLLRIRSESEGAEPVGMQVLLFWIESHLEGVPLKDYYARKVAEQKQI